MPTEKAEASRLWRSGHSHREIAEALKVGKGAVMRAARLDREAFPERSKMQLKLSISRGVNKYQRGK